MSVKRIVAISAMGSATLVGAVAVGTDFAMAMVVTLAIVWGAYTFDFILS